MADSNRKNDVIAKSCIWDWYLQQMHVVAPYKHLRLALQCLLLVYAEGAQGTRWRSLRLAPITRQGAHLEWAHSRSPNYSTRVANSTLFCMCIHHAVRPMVACWFWMDCTSVQSWTSSLIMKWWHTCQCSVTPTQKVWVCNEGTSNIVLLPLLLELAVHHICVVYRIPMMCTHFTGMSDSTANDLCIIQPWILYRCWWLVEVMVEWWGRSQNTRVWRRSISVRLMRLASDFEHGTHGYFPSTFSSPGLPLPPL